MAWFKVDDQLAFHSKAMAAGNAAMGLWVRAGSFCAQQLTDGYVPKDIAETLGTRRQAERLVDAGLWKPEAGGYRYHDWVDFQPSRAEIQQKRAATAARLKRWREARRDET